MKSNLWSAPSPQRCWMTPIDIQWAVLDSHKEGIRLRCVRVAPSSSSGVLASFRNMWRRVCSSLLDLLNVTKSQKQSVAILSHLVWFCERSVTVSSHDASRDSRELHKKDNLVWRKVVIVRPVTVVLPSSVLVEFWMFCPFRSATISAQPSLVQKPVVHQAVLALFRFSSCSKPRTSNDEKIMQILFSCFS